MTTPVAPLCLYCAHRRGTLRDPKCDAFPTGIPASILLSQLDHREPVGDDRGIRFKPKTPADAAYAARVFRDEEKR